MSIGLVQAFLPDTDCPFIWDNHDVSRTWNSIRADGALESKAYMYIEVVRILIVASVLRCRRTKVESQWWQVQF